MLSVKSAVLRRDGRRAKRRKPRSEKEEKYKRDESEEARRRRNELKAQWRPPEAVILPVAVFLHNRFSGSSLSFLFFFPFRPSSLPLRRRSLLAAAGPSRFSPQEAPRLLRHCLYLPTSVTYTPPRARSARGGLYLNNIHELRYTRQIYCPGTRGFCEDLQPLRPFPLRAYFLTLLVLRASLPFSRLWDHPPRLLARVFALLADVS